MADLQNAELVERVELAKFKGDPGPGAEPFEVIVLENGIVTEHREKVDGRWIDAADGRRAQSDSSGADR